MKSLLVVLAVLYTWDCTQAAGLVAGVAVAGPVACLCAGVPDCSHASAPWCVRKWPNFYPDANCAVDCCSPKWYTNAAKTQEIQCPDRKVCPDTTGKIGICVELCKDCDGNFSPKCCDGQLCCSNGCGHVCTTPVEPICPPKQKVFNCFADPCQVNPIDANCRKLFPDATCVSNYCGGCNFFWYETSAKLKPLKCPQVGCKEDLKRCSDGSVVVRDPKNNCEFPKCPIGCKEDLKRCSDGSVVVRDPKNNCEFPKCPMACTEDAKRCPDGSFVSRDPKNNCEFFPCPVGCKEDLKRCSDGSVVVRDPKNNCEFPKCPIVVYGCPCVPAVKRLCPTKPEHNECKSDEDCLGKEKCCEVACGKFECIESVPKPGFCKKVNNDIRCIRQDDVRCGADSCCDGQEKCCGTPCGGTQCTGDIHPCPPGVYLSRCKANPCDVNPIDDKCKKYFPDATCVPNYCGGCFFQWYETSAKMKPLQCPRPCTKEAKICPDGSSVGRNPYNNCQFDPCLPVFCTADAKLCPDGTSVGRDPKNGCTFRPCPDVVIGCPRVPLVRRLCPSPPHPDECHSHDDCKGKAKCCKVPCEKFECIVSKPKPGTCAKVDSTINCGQRDTVSCGVDDDCDNQLKCCGTPCNGTKCTAPAPCYPKGKDATWASGQCQCRKKKQCKGKWVKCKKGKKCPKKHVCCCPRDFWNKDCDGKKHY